MLQEAGVDPESLKTWDGYISGAVKLNDFFGDRVIQGVHLLGASHDLDMWYPYLWMLGGEILSYVKVILQKVSTGFHHTIAPKG